MTENRDHRGGRVRKFLNEHQELILLGMLILFLVVALIAMWKGHELATVAFIIASGAMLTFLFPGIVESIRFGTLEMKMREVNNTVAEARDLATLLAEIAIPLAHHSVGWAETAPATVLKKDAVIGRIMRLKEVLQIKLSDEILEWDYVKTCGDYVHFIIESLGPTRKRQFLKDSGTIPIPATIEDVLPPHNVTNILRKLECLDDYMQGLIDDYQYYYKNREHRSWSRWQRRAEWKRPEPTKA